jgi:polysaccharide biosynthesis protein PelG
MAGIGFRLQAMASEGSYIKATTAYASSAVISAGPWISGVVALAVLRGVSWSFLSTADHDLLFATLVIVFAASLLLAGGPQMVITRYLADRIYMEDMGAITPTAMGTLALMLPLTLITLPFVLWAPFDLSYRLLTATLFMTLVMTWLLMVFISAARDHWRVVLVLCCGYVLSVTLAIGLGFPFGVLGALGGFTLGQVTGLVLLVLSISMEFPSHGGISFAYLSYLRPFWDLGLIGICYMAGIWADSIVFWISHGSIVVGGFYHLFPPNDMSKFLVELPTIPSSAFFLVHLETHFNTHYRDFYKFIMDKQPLAKITAARQGMIASVRSGMMALIKIQGLVSLFVCLAAPQIARYVGLAPQWVPLLRVESFAAGAQFFTLVAILLLLYLDQRRVALIVAVTFVASNFILTQIAIHLGQSFYGWGYLIATLASAILGWYLLQDRLERLEYITFMSQPLTVG